MADIPKLNKILEDKYTVLDNTYIQVAKDDPKDKIEVEIGDSKVADDFLPQQKIMRWDNECNVSIRLKDFDNFTVETEGEKIKLVKPEKEVLFYNEKKERQDILEAPIVEKMNFGKVDVFEVPALYEIDKHIDLTKPRWSVYTPEEKCFVFWGPHKYEEDLVSEKENLPFPVIRFHTKDGSSPVMFLDENTIIFDFNYNDLNFKVDNLFLIETLEASLSSVLSKYGIEIYREHFRFFYKGNPDKKFCSVGFEQGHFTFYVRIKDVDPVPFLDHCCDSVKNEKESYVVGGLSELNENIDTGFIDELTKEFFKRLDLPTENLSVTEDETSTIESIKSVLSTEEWIRENKRTDIRVDVQEEKYLKDFNEQDKSEFEVSLKERPISNVIEFTLEDKDVEYLYQRALTQQEIDDGVFRPKNVIGSYAVYAKETKHNYVGGKEYKCGKIGHIYRPRIEDAVGDWAWGELHIENGILSVTIPQDFLDNAVYPVRHAAGLTFGYESIGGTYTNYNDRITGSQFTGAAGTIQSLTAYNGGHTNATDHYEAAIYKHSDLGLLANSTIQIDNSSGLAAWTTGTYGTDPDISAEDYILVKNTHETASDTFWWDDGDGTTQGHYDAETYGSFPATLGPTHEDKKYSIYVTYTAGEGGTNTQINIGDSWKEIDSMQINIGDSWKAVSGAQQNIGDTWKEIF